jgi:hypothetical protein
MELSPYLEGLRRDLAAAAAPAGPDVARAADLLAGSLEVAARMCLLEALSDAAAEITTRLAHGSVEVRLRGREAQLVVTEAEPATEPDQRPPAGTQTGTEADQGDIARLTLRLPEGLKEAVERAAAAESISVNAWLVRAITAVVSGTPGSARRSEPPTRGRLGRRVTGYAQA